MLGQHLSEEPSMQYEGHWCPKCESFFKEAAEIARNCGFKLCGGLYGSKLTMRCVKAKHSVVLSYQRRLTSSMKCAECKKEEREAVKHRLIEEERLQDAYYSQMQEQMFAEARREMEQELAGQAFAGIGFGFHSHSAMFMDETQRQAMLEQQIDQTAQALATQFMAAQGSPCH